MVYTGCIGNLYEIPPNEILENRKEFYRLQRGIGESIEMWLNEVQNHGNCCDFSKFVELILIDKFFCELNNDERDFIRSKHLSLQRLNDYFLKRNFDYGQMDTNRFANLKECLPMIDDVKLEPDDYLGYSETEPIGQIEGEEYSFGTDEPLKIEEVIPSSPPNAPTPIDITPNGHTPIVNEEDIDVNLIDGMQCEVEEYKYAIHEPIEKKILMVDAETSMNDFQSDDDAQMEPLESLKCLNCSANHSNHSELDQHLRNVHNEIVIHKCPHCFIEFHEYVDLLEHFKSHLGLKRIKCNLCRKWFLYQKQLQYHVQTVHRNSFQINCPDCGKVSKSSENFQSHYRAEHMKPNDTIICRLGNIKFTKFATFIAHLRTEQKKVLHTRDSSEREKHSVVHKPKIQDYPCKWCGKHLPSLAKRKARDTLHMKEKPYLCSLCTKSFTRWMYLRRHEKRMHSINKQN